METWQRIGEEDQAVQSVYWNSISRFNLYGLDSEEVAHAARQLVANRQSQTAVEILASISGEFPVEVVAQVLEAVPTDIEIKSAGRLSSYELARLFEMLDQSSDVSDGVIAKLEIPYIGVLEHDRPKFALHREVTSDPSTFADLISWAFKRTEGSDEGSDDDETDPNRAQVAFEILWRLRGLPGLMEDDTVDPIALSYWVSEARRLCGDRSREEIGENQVGHILANAPGDPDGTWPCESVRDGLDEYKSQSIGEGFVIGKRNLRGVTSRGVLEGGGQERSLAGRYLTDASNIAAKWPFTAKLLREIAESFGREGHMHDQESDWRDQIQA